MPKICYNNKLRFGADTQWKVERADQICQEYADQGLILSLRQLYYQFVARGLIPNSQEEYKKLGDVVNRGRLAGLIDWNHLEDRGRNMTEVGHFNSPADVIEAAFRAYRLSKWDTQPYYIEVWIEKQALEGVVHTVCTNNDVPYFSCKGYNSQSEAWSAAQRIMRRTSARRRELEDGSVEFLSERKPIILHFGDHDPSGIDMTRDIGERFETFCWAHNRQAPRIIRLALNMDQVIQYDPPPNPAKVTDSRFRKYQDEHGDESWELDALDPTVITALIQTNIQRYRDAAKWREAVAREDEERSLLRATSTYWPDLRAHLEENFEIEPINSNEDEDDDEGEDDDDDE